MPLNTGFPAAIKERVRAHPIAAFCVWFFPVAWTIAMLSQVASRPFGLELPMEVFISGATLLGGLLPVLVITRLVDGPSGLRAFLQRLVPRRLDIGWYALAVLATPLLSLGIAVAVYGPPNVTTSTLVSALVEGLLVQTLVGLVFVNLWEETTWMGFVQARLQARHGVLLAAVLTAAGFTFQHLPLVVQGGLLNPLGLVILVVFFLLSIPFRALTGWMYNRTGSLFLVGLLHAVGDATTNGSLASGFLARLYDGYDVGFFHIFALSLIGMVVLIATRARLGASAPRRRLATVG